MRACLLLSLALPLSAATITIGTGESVTFHYSNIPETTEMEFNLFTVEPVNAQTALIANTSGTMYVGYRFSATINSQLLFSADAWRMGWTHGESPLGVGFFTGTGGTPLQLGNANWRVPMNDAKPSGDVQIRVMNLGLPVTVSPTPGSVSFTYRRPDGVQTGSLYSAVTLPNTAPPPLSSQPSSEAATPEPSTWLLTGAGLLCGGYLRRAKRRQGA